MVVGRTTVNVGHHPKASQAFSAIVRRLA